MDVLLTLPTPRKLGNKASYAHKVSARSNNTAASPVQTPHPPVVRKNSGSPETLARHRSPREAFRSSNLLNEIARVENARTRGELTPEEAIQHLQRIIPEVSSRSNLPDDLADTRLLRGIEDACWCGVSFESKLRPECRQSAAMQRGVSEAVRYSSLYHGLTERIQEKHRAIQVLESQIQEVSQRTSSLPQTIQERKHEIACTIASFVQLSATALDCAAPEESPETDVENEKTADRLTKRVNEHIVQLHRRKELREWACNELRSVINDHMTRTSELKKEITVVLGEVKREELNNKVKTKRMEEAMAGMSGAPHHQHSGRKSSLVGVMASPRGGGQDRGSKQNVVEPPSSPNGRAKTRLARAHEWKIKLLEKIDQRRGEIRRRTEEIFDVRNRIRDVEQKRADVLADRNACEAERAHVERSCTPRPNWEELRRAVTVTTAADHVGKRSRARLRGQRRAEDDDEDEDEEEVTERRLEMILASKWSTIDKVQALSKELARIRLRYHAGDELDAEQAKLDQLHGEIQRTLQQLAVVRGQSRGDATAQGSL